MKRLLAAVAIVAGFGLAVGSAEAGGVQFYLGSGYGGYGCRAPSYNYYGGNFGNYSYQRSGRVWHDTSHFDYHPGEYVRHRNHYHYQPGHYDFHSTGHWDRVGRGSRSHRGHHH